MIQKAEAKRSEAKRKASPPAHRTRDPSYQYLYVVVMSSASLLALLFLQSIHKHGQKASLLAS